MNTARHAPSTITAERPTEPPAIPQYSMRRVLGTWAAAAVPMALMAWVAAPWLAAPGVSVFVPGLTSVGGT